MVPSFSLRSVSQQQGLDFGKFLYYNKKLEKDYEIRHYKKSLVKS